MINSISLIITIFLLVFAIGIFVYLISIYNQLIQVRVNIEKSWANIEVLEKQRYDEIPKLIKVCEGYMKYERETLEKITSLRTKFLEAKTPKDYANIDNQLSSALKTLFVVAENYPDLKSNENFKQLQNRISYLENQIADRREFYNDAVFIYNTRIKQIPDIFIANLLGYKEKEMYKISEQEKISPEIKFEFPK